MLPDIDGYFENTLDLPDVNRIFNFAHARRRIFFIQSEHAFAQTVGKFYGLYT